MTIFQRLEEYLNKYDIPFTNITAVATDGEPAMISSYRSFAAFLKKKIFSVSTIHCVLHQNHLVAKNLSNVLHDTLKMCIKSINQIRAYPLKSRLFTILCEKDDELSNQLLLHTEVR